MPLPSALIVKEVENYFYWENPQVFHTIIHYSLPTPARPTLDSWLLTLGSRCSC
jgi:hypothetical protein